MSRRQPRARSAASISFLEEVVGHPVIRKVTEPEIEERLLEDEGRASP